MCFPWGHLLSCALVDLYLNTGCTSTQAVTSCAQQHGVDLQALHTCAQGRGHMILLWSSCVGSGCCTIPCLPWVTGWVGSHPVALLLWSLRTSVTTGTQGTELQEAAAKETAALCPPHQFVPWVVVEDVPLEDTFEQLRTYVCVALRANPKYVWCCGKNTRGFRERKASFAIFHARDRELRGSNSHSAPHVLSSPFPRRPKECYEVDPSSNHAVGYTPASNTTILFAADQ